MNKLVVLVLALFLFDPRVGCALPSKKNAANGRVPENYDSSDDLGTVLKKASDYCAKLKAAALFFICDEEVRERIYIPYRIFDGPRIWTTESNSFTYDYQLVRKENIIESRTLVRENRAPRNEKNASLKTSRFWYQYVVFGPIGIFSADTQLLHSYTLVREERLWGRPAFVVSVTPLNKVEVGWLYGKAWIDAEVGAVLKIEWAGESMKNITVAQEFAESINAKPKLTHSSEYRYEQKGIHFPSFFEIREEYEQMRPTLSGKRRLLKSELEVTYKNYKFFVVETEDKVIR